MEKRNCIFTGKPANAKLTVTLDKHNWAKEVPCSREYISGKGSRELNELEIRLVELFYQQEIARLRVEHYEAQMAEIRSLLTVQKPKRRSVKEISASMEEINNRKPDFDSIRTETAHPEVPEGVKVMLENKEIVTKENFGELLLKSANEALEHAKGENHIKEPEEEYEPEPCPNPVCPSMLQHAPGIGPFCPNKECDVGDGPDVWKEKDEELTEEKEDVKIEKKVVKKKSSLKSIWD